jgi:solute carrier family 25, member 39/40
MSTQEIVCVWENGVFRTERVSGFLDAVRHVWHAEGIRGLWKGAGTTLYAKTRTFSDFPMLINLTLE